MAIIKQTFVADKNILIAPELALTLSCKIANTGITAVNGKKMALAGSPLAGNIEERGTAFTVSQTAPIGVLLHDVDVTDGTNNGTIVVTGCVDLLKLDTTVIALLDSATKTLLNKIIFVKGAK